MRRAFTIFTERYQRLDNWLDRGDLVLDVKSEPIIRLPETVNFLMQQFGSENEAVRLAISSAIARVHGDESPPVVYATLMRAIKEPVSVQKDYNQFSNLSSEALVDAAMGLCFFPAKRDNTVIELVGELDKHSRFVGTNLAHALLCARFPLDPPQPVNPNSLTVDQCLVLRAIAESRRPWTLNVNMAESLSRFGLPTDRKSFIQFVAICGPRVYATKTNE